MSNKSPSPSGGTSLLSLPPEITQDIAYLLPKDADIINLALCCSLLHNMIMPAESLIWRRLFRDAYDIPRQRSSAELKFEYQARSIVLAQRITFRWGDNEEGTLWLEVLRDMLLESYETRDPSNSKNIERIRGAFSTPDFLDRPSYGYIHHDPDPPSGLFCAVQLCLTGMALDQSMLCRCLRTDYDIGVVYAYGADTPNALIDAGEIDLFQLLQIRNFWVRHLLNTDEDTYSESYRSLLGLQKPRAGGSFGGTLELPTKWIGYYSCFHPYSASISKLEEEQTCATKLSHLPAEPMTLHITTYSDDMNWPHVFQEVIPLLEEESNRSYFRGFQSAFVDDSVSLVRGFVEAVEPPQAGFPGWRRVCFVLYLPHGQYLDLLDGDYMGEFTNQTPSFPQEPWPPFDLENDVDWIHGYEGLVLPGGQIMIGRWVDMRDLRARGPFIFWVTESLRMATPPIPF